MRVIFYADREESDIVELPDNTTEEELNTKALDWLQSEVSACYEILDEKER